MQHVSLIEGYEGVRLSINNFPKTRTPEIDKMLHEYVETRNEPGEARDLLAKDIVKKLKEAKCK